MKVNMIKLGDVATYINGYAFKPEDRGEVGLPIIRIQDLTGNAYDLGFYNGDYPKRIEINDGDVLISWSASLGVYVWNRGRALLNQHIFKVEFDKVNIDKSYFVYAVRQKLAEMAMKTHGATMKHIVKKDFEETLIPYPSQKKQIEIGTNLDKIANIIAARKQQLELLDELVKARFVEMFGDARKNPNKYDTVSFIDIVEYMGDIGSNGANKVVVDHLDMKDKEDYAMMVRFTNFTKNDFTDDVKYVSKEAYDFFKKSQIFGGELIICKIGSAGQNYVMPYLNRPVSLGLNQIMVRIKDNILMPYLYQYLHTDYGEFLISGCINGAVTKTITKTELKKIPVMLPPMELQREFVAFVEQVDKSKVSLYYKNRKGGFPPLLFIYSVTTIINLSDY